MTEAPPTTTGLDPRQRRRVLAAVIACVAIYGITNGLSHPLLSLILEDRGVERSLIGLVAAAPSLAMIVIAPLLPAIVRALGMRPFILLCITLDASLFLLLPVFDSLLAWLLLRCVMGLSVAGLFIASETWINEIATDDTRGRVVGLYNTVLSGTFAIGPLLIPVTGIHGWTPFVVGAGFVLLAALPLAWAGRSAPMSHGRSGFGVLRFVLVAPTVCAAIALMAFKDTAGMSLLPVYAVSAGLSTDAASVMLSTTILGALFLQLPIGWLADRVHRGRLLLACGAVGGIGALLLPTAVEAGWWLWPMLFLWGGVFSGLYTVAMAMVGQRFRGAELVTAMSAFGLLWGVASLVAPPAAGVAMDAVGRDGLVMALAGGCGLFLAVGLLRRAHLGAARG